MSINSLEDIKIFSKIPGISDATIALFYLKVDPKMHPEFHCEALKILKENRPVTAIMIEGKLDATKTCKHPTG